MREIVIDTETTGLDPQNGHRIVEIGCVELLNAIPTGAIFHIYVNPERDMPQQAFEVHGLSGAFLAEKPVFATVVEDFLAFIDGARIVAHNAEFDLRFLNAEFAFLGIPPIAQDRVVDTLSLARRKFPGSANSLDALCGRFGIATARRIKHGALLDAELLAEVYAELTGGRQAALSFDLGEAPSIPDGQLLTERPHPLPPRASNGELSRHQCFAAGLGETPIWSLYFKLFDRSALSDRNEE
jgi:DNA polymerase-3 subunit epsilon